MTREPLTCPIRCVVVWLLVTLIALGAWRSVADAVGSLGSSHVWHGTFEDLLVALASAAVVISLGRLWVITTATVLAVARGRVPSEVPRGATRRLVLVACGVAVVAGVTSPALADTPSEAPSPGHASGHSSTHSGNRSLIGLPMPDRAVARPGPQPSPAPVADRSAEHPSHRRTPSRPAVPAAPITVRAGDSLWSIAADRLGPDAGVAAIDAAWRELYAANLDVIGTDADLILPGLDLEQGPNREARP